MQVRRPARGKCRVSGASRARDARRGDRVLPVRGLTPAATTPVRSPSIGTRSGVAVPHAFRYLMDEPGAPFVARPMDLAPVAARDVVVEVAGCGVCHTDLGFFYDGVKTRAALPLCLGHEISGMVVETGSEAGGWLGKAVIVPAVLPCGECPLCRTGGACICTSQVMPGNDVHGGFASHVAVPSRWLCEVPGCTSPDQRLGATGVTLRELSVVADAVSTPYQAVLRSGLEPGGLAIVIGAGGVGGYAVSIAAARGATVIALDVDPGRLEASREFGARAVLDVRNKAYREIKKAVASLAKELSAPSQRWRIFECSGTRAGQETAWGLLVQGAYLAVVGFTMDPVEVRLSNLMAFDATARGNWGCDPALYPEVLRLVLEGDVAVSPRVELMPLSKIDEAFRLVHEKRIGRRVVLVPDPGVLHA